MGIFKLMFFRNRQTKRNLVRRQWIDVTFYAMRMFVCMFVCFVALRPKSTAMVIAGRSVHLTTLFPGQA